MSKVIVVALLVAVVCGVAFAAPTISIAQLGGKPANWGQANDLDLANWDTVSLPYSDDPYRLHIGIEGGIWGFHIVGLPTISQGLFAQQNTNFTADLSGTWVPSDSYLSFDSNAGLDLSPMPEPSGLLALGFGVTGLAGLAVRKRR